MTNRIKPHMILGRCKLRWNSKANKTITCGLHFAMDLKELESTLWFINDVHP